MLSRKTEFPQPGQRSLPPPASPSNMPRQRRLMLVALGLLLISLTLVLYRDRDFWFPDTDGATAQALNPAPIVARNDVGSSAQRMPAAPQKRRHSAVYKQADTTNTSPTPPLTITRTVLPPLEVEVVAGDSHRSLRPGNNSVQVDLERAPNKQGGPVPVASEIATPAAERASISTETSASMVMESIQPEYPLLARQMKVQGSVTLQALIGRDGLIQDLRVLSGPPILAAAAREAVRQWHFKPHYEGSQTVETRANITVNFTISTN